jgi:hypothetical protein
VEAKELYLLGPGVGSREDLGQVVEAARGLAVVLEVEPGAIDGGRVAELEGMGIEVRES